MMRLRSVVDWQRYDPVAGAPEWLGRLARNAETQAGVLAVIGPSGISFIGENLKPQRPVLDPAAVYVAGIADSMRNTGKRVAVAIPPAARHIPLLISASVVLADTLDRQQVGYSGRGGVLLISPDLELRSQYCSLRVGKEAIDLTNPGGRMKPDGSYVPLKPSRGREANGVCFFYPLLQLPARIAIDPGLIVIDLRFALWSKRAKDLCAWAVTISRGAGVLALYTLGDLDTSGALDASGFSQLPLDHAAIATCDQGVRKPETNGQKGPRDWTLAPAPGYLKREHEIHFIPPTAATQTARSIRRLLSEHRKQDSPDLRRARWLLSTLETLPVPLVWYEEAARSLGRSTIKRMIARLGVFRRGKDDLGAVLQTLRMQFDQLYAEVEATNLRAETLLGVLDREMLAPGDRSAVLLLRDAVTERAVRNWYELDRCREAKWLSKLTIASCPGYSNWSEISFEVAVVNGPLPRRYRWIAGAALGRHVHIVAAVGEEEVAERQLKAIYDMASDGSRSRERTLKAWVQLPDSRSVGNLQVQSETLVIARPESPVEPAAKQTKQGKRLETVGTSLTALGTALELHRQREAADRLVSEPVAWEEETVDEDAATEDLGRESEAGDVDDVEALRVDVYSKAQGKGYLWLQQDEVVECVRPSAGTDIQRIEPGSLEAGDVLLLLNDERRSSVFDRIVEVAERQPQLQYLARFRVAWRDAVRKVAAKYTVGKHIDFGRMLKELRNAGAPIETEIAVRGWVRDLVIGPEKLQSIAAIGRLAGDDTIVRQTKDFDRAFHRIRSIRQGIGRRISAAIRSTFAQARFSRGHAEVETLDETLGLPLDELVDTIDLVQVLAIDPQSQTLQSHVIGKFISAD